MFNFRKSTGCVEKFIFSWSYKFLVALFTQKYIFWENGLLMFCGTQCLWASRTFPIFQYFLRIHLLLIFLSGFSDASISIQERLRFIFSYQIYQIINWQLKVINFFINKEIDGYRILKDLFVIFIFSLHTSRNVWHFKLLEL